MGAHFLFRSIYATQKSKNYDEQVQILESKGLEISDKKFRNKTTFEQLKNIYYFDAELRNLIMGAIDEIEIYLKSQISYYHSQKYDAEGYLDTLNFNKNHNHSRFMKHVNACINENQRTLVVKHHIANYDGHFPIRVLIEYFSIGMLSYFYRDLRNSDKATIAKETYGVNYQTLDSWFRCLTDLRNKCAHYSRLYYWIFTALPRMPQNEKYVPTRRLFAQIYMLKMMYPDHEKWNNNFLKPLVKLMKKYKSDVVKDHIDFPFRWKSMLTYKE